MDPSNLARNFPEPLSAPEEWMAIVLHGKFMPHITSVAKVVAAYSDENGISSPRIKDACEEGKLRPEDAQDGLQALLNMLLLESVANPGGGLRYRLTRPDGTPIVPLKPPTPGRKRSESTKKRRGIRRKETVLYRYYDGQDVLLYVGITANMPSRFGSHETDSTWMDFAVRSTIERFTNRDDALAAEKAAIEEHAPLFNVEHNDRPDRVRRIVDYLIERDRRDLLVPLISRG